MILPLIIHISPAAQCSVYSMYCSLTLFNSLFLLLITVLMFSHFIEWIFIIRNHTYVLIIIGQVSSAEKSICKK